MKLNLDQFQSRQASKSLDDANEALRRMIRETYKWLLAPMQEARPGKGLSEIQWEHFPVNPGAQNLSQEIERVLKENELLITEWAPIHLATLLKTWFWKDGVRETNALNVWQQSCQQLYLPRLRDDTVFQATLAAGSDSRDFFGFAQGKEEDRYLGFTYGKLTSPFFDSSLILIEAVTAAGYAEAQRAAEEAAKPKAADMPATATTGSTSRVEDSATSTYSTGGGTTPQVTKKHFFGSIELDAIQAKKQFADLVDEVVLQFTSRPGVKVRIAIEIQPQVS